MVEEKEEKEEEEETGKDVKLRVSNHQVEKADK